MSLRSGSSVPVIIAISGALTSALVAFGAARLAEVQPSILASVSSAQFTTEESIHRWVFAPDHLIDDTVRDIGAGAESLDGQLIGDPALAETADGWALALDGRTQSVQMGEVVDGSGLPKRSISVEAWVNVFSTTRWGGVVGAVRDNLDAETGWVLGYDDTRFTFALASTGADDGDGALTYLAADVPLVPRQWHHVVATYDGLEMRLYVDSTLAGVSSAQSGDILYPTSTFFDIGAYHDSDEHWRLSGQITEVSVYDRALDQYEVATHFGLRSALAGRLVPSPTPTLSPTPAPTATPGHMDNRRVLIIGIDGTRPDGLTTADTPFIDGLIDSGAQSFLAQTGDVTSSGPGWSSLLTGVWRDKHNVNSNAFADPRYDLYPHFFARYKAFRNTGRTASIVHWAPINDQIASASSSATDVIINSPSDAAVADEAITLLSEDPALTALFLHFDDVDHAGHGTGYDPPYPVGNPYRTAIETVDGHIGRVLEALASRPGRSSERWLILVSTDHGGTGSGHGADIPEHRTIFFIVSGDGSTLAEIVPAPEIVDVAVTALTHLGVPIDPAWELDGRAVGIVSAPPTPTPSSTPLPGIHLPILRR